MGSDQRRRQLLDQWLLQAGDFRGAGGRAKGGDHAEKREARNAGGGPQVAWLGVASARQLR